ncbi:MAG: YbgA family protein [Kangiellaceae bacterium]
MIKVGISGCLLGANIRYDGGNKNNQYCKKELSKYFEFISLCPEVGIGLPIPRETIRLTGNIENPRAVQTKDPNKDFTEQLSHYADKNKELLGSLSGYIVCQASPSCGMERVKVYNEKGQPESKGVGIFTARLKSLYPNLPIEENGRLNDPLLKDSFIKRVFIYDEWLALVKSGLTVNKLLKFHSRHKMLLLAHCQPIYRTLGPIVAQATKQNLIEKSELYINQFMKALSKRSDRANNTNVLMHIQGHLKDLLSKTDKAELRQCIMDYNQGMQPILSPLTLLKHHFKSHPSSFIARQSYLNPYPKTMALRVPI